MKSAEIYTDGASRGNPGKGGWAAIILTGNNVTEIAGRKDEATNNQMELLAAEKSLEWAKNHDCSEVILHSDSAYVLNGIQSWIQGWQRNGWMTQAKKPVENKAQWQKLQKLKEHFGRNLKLVKVAGHSGHEYNDRCDELAVDAALGKKPQLFSGSLEVYKETLTSTPPKSMKKPQNKGEAYSYVSLVEGKVHVDKTWAACEKRVKGMKGVKYKKVFSKAEETDLIQDYTLAALL